MNKGSFFALHLIPLAQALFFVEEALFDTRLYRDKKVQNAIVKAKDLLGLVALRVMSMTDVQRLAVAKSLQPLASALQPAAEFRIALLLTFKAHKFEVGHLQGIRNGTRPSRPAVLKSFQERNLERLEAALVVVSNAIEYQASSRQKFVETHAENNPLGRTPSKWTTLVRNYSWADAPRILTLSGEVKGCGKMEDQGSHQGRERLPALWQEWFGQNYVVDGVEIPPDGLLPSYIKVESDFQGLLVLKVQGPTLGAFSKPEQTAIAQAEKALQRVKASAAKGAESDAPDAILQSVTTVKQVSWRVLAEEVEVAQRWYQEERSRILTRAASMEVARKGHEVEDLRKELKSALDPKAYKLLEGMLSAGINPLSEPAKATPAKATAAKKAAAKKTTARKTTAKGA